MIHGVLTDVHGVLYVHPQAVAGSGAALGRLRDANLPVLLLTNSSLFSKQWILESLREGGIEVAPGEILTAVEAAGFLLERAGHRRVGWLCAEAVREDLSGLQLVEPVPGAPAVEAVLVGDLGAGFTPAVLQQAFRWLMDGARLVAVGRNRFYQSGAGLHLDAGPYVALLEEAAQVEAVVAGKPNPAFFEAGLERLGLAGKACAMIGDDLESDVHPAMDLGLRGYQVRTGKFREEAYRAAPRPADALVADFAGAVEDILARRG